jgi:hypothetical protein
LSTLIPALNLIISSGFYLLVIIFFLYKLQKKVLKINFFLNKGNYKKEKWIQIVNNNKEETYRKVQTIDPPDRPPPRDLNELNNLNY